MTEMLVAIGDTVKIRGGCPHAWVVYAGYDMLARTTVHLQRWDDEKGKMVRETFVDPRILVKI